MPRRSIRLPLALGIALACLTAALAVGWQVLLVGDWRPVAQGLTTLHWVLIVLGSLFFVMVLAGLVLALHLAGARDAPEPAPAGFPRRRDARDEDTARVAAPLPRDALAARSGAGAPARLRRAHAVGRPAPRAHRGPGARRGARRGAPARARRAARPRRASPLVRRGGPRPPRPRRRGRALPSRAARARAREPRRAPGRVPQPPRERGEVLGRPDRRARVRAAPRERPRPCRDRGPRHRPRAARAAPHLPALLPGESRRPAPGAGARPRPLRRPPARAPTGRLGAGAKRRAGPRQPLHGDAEGAVARSRRRRRTPSPARGPPVEARWR